MERQSRYARWAVLALGLPAIYATPVQKRDDIVPTYDYSWIKRYAAIGDSFAAGIGVGDVESAPDAKGCSRYTGGYPNKMQSEIQAGDYQFLACSGAVSADMVEKQIPQLHDKYDLISVSAGGNDVGFSDVLKACLFLPKPKSDCDAALKTAEGKIDNELAGNIIRLLSEIGPHVNQDGAIVYTLYGQFFDLSPEPCNSQDWCLLGEPAEGACAHVTVELRTEFNRLVEKTNKVLTEVITTWSGRAYPAPWGGYAVGMGGQFCKSDSADRFDDPSNHGLAFIRPNIGQHFSIPGEKRDVMDYTWKRDIPLPDEIMRNFHPTELGTWMQASTALDYVALHRAKIDGKDNPDNADSCEWTPPAPSQPPADNLMCSDPEDPLSLGRYVSRDGMIANIEKFCTDIDGAKENQLKEYATDTYDGVRFFYVTPGHAITKAKCIEKLGVVADGCVPRPNNPMNWKYGGTIETEGWRIEAHPWGKRAMSRKTNDDKSPMQAPIAKCDSFYQFIRDEFWIYGAGFRNGDFGAELLAQMRHCVGGGVTDWSFEYYDEPDKDGYEWKAFGHTPIWQKNCFSPVIRGAGGPDIPCNGSG